MKRFLAAMTLGMVLVAGTVSVQAADLSVTMNGTAITFDAQPFIEQGITLVPMRAIMDTLDASVEWDAAAKTVTVTKGTVTSNSIQVNVNATDNESGMPVGPSYKYYIKPSSTSSYPTSSQTSNTFTGLEQNTSYDIKVEVADVAGNVGA